MRAGRAWLVKIALSASIALAPIGAGIARELKPWNGGPPPALELKDLNGRVHTLADYQGKVLVLNFWATWCEPCREEMPSFSRLKARLKNAPFAIVAVNMGEGEGRIGEFLRKVPIDFPILLDRDGAVSRAWRARLLPYTVVIGPDMKIRYTVLGEMDWSAPEVEAAIRKLLPSDH